MKLLHKTYGKGRVRVMRVHRDGDRQEVRELTVKAMVEGDFGRAFTHADNSTSLCTDTVKNVVNIIARGSPRPGPRRSAWRWRSACWSVMTASRRPPSPAIKHAGAALPSMASRIRTPSRWTPMASPSPPPP